MKKIKWKPFIKRFEFLHELEWVSKELKDFYDSVDYKEFEKMEDNVFRHLFCTHTYILMKYIEFIDLEDESINICVDLINSHDRDNIIIAANILVKLKPIK